MTPDAALVARVEAATALGWPAARSCTVAGWQVYLGEGHVGRTNSCWAVGAPPVGLSGAVDDVEAVYRQAGLAARFKLVSFDPVSAPLRAMLLARGYRQTSQVSVMVRSPADVASSGPHPVRITDALEPGFTATLMETGASAADGAERLAILRRVPEGVRFASIGPPQAPGAVGAGLWAGGSVGIAAMRTRAEARRKGHARQIVSALLADAARRGADLAWLQVETDNDAALALYRGLGFLDAYGYELWIAGR